MRNIAELVCFVHLVTSEHIYEKERQTDGERDTHTVRERERETHTQ